MSENYSVYMHIFPNKKKYIGQTCRDPKDRWRNGYGYKEQQIVFKAIKKYGWNNILHAIPYTNLTKQEADNLEIDLISRYKTTDRRYGYNIDNGGNKAGTHSEETKRKISEGQMGKVLSNYTKDKISKSRLGVFTEKQREHHWSNTGVWKPYKGYFTHTEETKKKLSDIRNKNKDKYNKSVVQIDKTTDEIIDIFESASDVERKLGIDRSSIDKVCRGERKTAGGYKWKFYKNKKGA